MRRPREVLKSAAVQAMVALVALLGVGCGPIEYMNQVSSKAAGALAAAKAARADRYALYEYTAAEEYLQKAREEAGHSAFQVSIEYGRKSEELANKARAIALERSSQPDEPSRSGPSGPRKP